MSNSENSNDNLLIFGIIVVICIMFILCGGEPDLLDAIIHNVRNG